jgi:ribonuclease VapC
LTGLVIDTSVLIAILNGEPEDRSFAEACHSADTLLISAASLHEANCVVVRKHIDDGGVRLGTLVDKLRLSIVPFDLVQMKAAVAAYARYGRGTEHRANLNMGDCFAYALAKTRGLPLLFKGDDFVHTDVELALKPA